MTSVEICNVALAQLGLPRITALSNSTDEAIACNLHLQPTIDELLEERAWTWALTWGTLARSPDTNLSKYDYLYYLPTSMIHLVRLEDEDNNAVTDVEFFGDVVATDSETMQALYVASVTNHGKLPPSFARAVSMMIGYKIAIDFQMARNLGNEMYQYAQVAIMRARQQDAKRAFQKADVARWGDIY